jgi:hypothetical protein
MSREFTQAEVDEAVQFAELEDRAIDFLTNKLGFAALLGRGVFSVGDSPSRREAGDNFTAVDEPGAEDGTLLKLRCDLWATIDWSRPDVGQQIEAGIRRMGEFLLRTADGTAATWTEDQAWREKCRRHHEKQGAIPQG